MAQQTATIKTSEGIQQVVLHTSARWALTALDWAKAGIMAGLSAAGGVVLSAIQQNGLHFDKQSLHTILGTAAVGTIGYLLKQFGTNTKVVEVNEADMSGQKDSLAQQ